MCLLRVFAVLFLQAPSLRLCSCVVCACDNLCLLVFFMSHRSPTNHLLRRRYPSIMAVTNAVFKTFRHRKRNRRDDGIVFPVAVEVLIRSFLTGAADRHCSQAQLDSLLTLLVCCRDFFFRIHDTAEATELAIASLPSMPPFGHCSAFDTDTQAGCEIMHKFSGELFALFASLQITKCDADGLISFGPFQRDSAFYRRRTFVDSEDSEVVLHSADDVFAFVLHVVFPDRFPLPSTIVSVSPYKHVARCHANDRTILFHVFRATLAFAHKIFRWSRMAGGGGATPYFNIAYAIQHEACMCVDTWCPLHE